MRYWQKTDFAFQTLAKLWFPRGRWRDGFHWGWVWLEQSDQAVKGFAEMWGGGKVALVKVEPSHPGSERNSGRGMRRGHHSMRPWWDTRKVKSQLQSRIDSVLTESPHTGGGSKTSSILFLKGFISLVVLWMKKGKWPVYPEVVSPEDNLWESFIGEEHVDCRGVRYLGRSHMEYLFSLPRLVRRFSDWSVSDLVPWLVWLVGRRSYWSYGWSIDQRASTSQVIPSMAPKYVVLSSGYKSYQKKGTTIHLTRMVSLVLHAPIGLVPLQAGELIGRTHWGHKVCSSDKSEKKGVEKWCISTENCSTVANCNVFALGVFLFSELYLCWCISVVKFFQHCHCACAGVFLLTYCKRICAKRVIFAPICSSRGGMFSVGKGISKNANDTNQECSEIAENEKCKYKKSMKY